MLRHPISRGGAFSRSPPPPSTNRVAVRHSPPKSSTLIGRPRRFLPPRRDVTCGASDQDFQSYRNVVMYVWAIEEWGQKQSPMKHSRFGEFYIHILVVCEPNHDLLNHA